MFRRRIKDRGGKDQIGPGRNEYEKTGKKEDKRSWTYVNKLLVSMLVLENSNGWGLCLGSIPGGG